MLGLTPKHFTIIILRFKYAKVTIVFNRSDNFENPYQQ